MLLREFRRRFYRFSIPSILICLMFYFAYHIVQGDRGLLSWVRLQQKLKDSKVQLLALRDEHDHLENKVRLLRPESLCLDLLSEQAKMVLGYMDRKEVMVLRKTSEIKEIQK
ncbi:FtsB family cell division protein [Candidatus Nucleicultrix amoebiphila]|jgi:cell division protein FtsB|uniref:Septum formation initiator n=1 Tax=Candidatus Nucleicultrix amoebiphila FS5 TaxID=1414854 RepID=A0A1W6N2Q6_9PROT|nr:septum formation initiator family protein [Candidatus Nucleicultrix amoebiphila]ARN84112.1 hypothetical protein GQ61_00755 [Candidatus Nucleicultrix amoebiphila FS5]